MTVRAVISGGAAAVFIALGAVASEAPDRSLRPESRPASQPLVGPESSLQASQDTVLAPVIEGVSDAADAVADVVVGIVADAAAVGITGTGGTEDEVVAMAVSADLLTVTPVPLAGPDLPALAPRIRPLSDQVIAAAARVETDPVFSPDASLRPSDRPETLMEKVLFGKRKKRKGSVCGDIDIQGEKVGNYGKGGGCYIADAVRVKSVSGVRLSSSALMTCKTAEALNTWVDKAVQPAFSKQVVELKVAAHYACRTRNNRAGAKLSEHAKGRAIDISAFTLKNGKQVTVLNDWGRGKYGKALAKSHAKACGIFGTVLGPRSDGYHRDHFHLDTANYRSGAYCR